MTTPEKRYIFTINRSRKARKLFENALYYMKDVMFLSPQPSSRYSVTLLEQI